MSRESKRGPIALEGLLGLAAIARFRVMFVKCGYAQTGSVMVRPFRVEQVTMELRRLGFSTRVWQEGDRSMVEFALNKGRLDYMEEVVKEGFGGDIRYMINYYTRVGVS